jgi:hypothetical protein
MLKPVSRQSVDYSQRLVLRSSSGSLAMLAAMRRASSRVKRCAARSRGQGAQEFLGRLEQSETGKRDWTAGQLTAPSGEEVMGEWSRAKFCDVVNLFLGTILFFSPWLFSLSLDTPRHTAAIAGLFIAVLSIAALTAFALWEEWLNLIAGLCLIASPWLLGFQDSDAMTVDVVIGTIVAALAAFEAWVAHDRSPTTGSS